jgi:hypothetical protein
MEPGAAVERIRVRVDGAHALTPDPTGALVAHTGLGDVRFTSPAQEVLNESLDAFVARLPSTLTSTTQVTYLGGSDGDEAIAIAIHPTTGDVYVAGNTASANFPGTTGGAQPAFGGPFDAFVARLPSTLTSLA